MKITQACVLKKEGDMKKIGLIHLILILVLMISTPVPAATPLTIKLGVVTKPGNLVVDAVVCDLPEALVSSSGRRHQALMLRH